MNTQELKFDVAKVIRESPRKKCVCGNEYFDTATVQVEMSPLMTGSPKTEIALVKVLVCRKCGTEDVPKKIQTP